MTERICFLDMDGVCNSNDYLLKQSKLWSNQNAHLLAPSWNPDDGIDPEKMLLLNRLVKEAGVRFVISSSWRYAYEPARMQKMLNAKGFLGEVIGETPAFTDIGRSHEIAAWLYDDEFARYERAGVHAVETVEVESFVVLDDIDMTNMFGERAIVTDEGVGLTEADVEQALKWLKEPWDGALRMERQSER